MKRWKLRMRAWLRTIKIDLVLLIPCTRILYSSRFIMPFYSLMQTFREVDRTAGRCQQRTRILKRRLQED